MDIREPHPSDLDALLEFFARIPEAERTFFKEPVLDRAAVESWLSGAPGRRGLACADGQVAGYVAVVPLTGWSDHVGEVRLVVDPARRGTGLGRALARWALLQALELGLAKLYVEVVADQEGAVATSTYSLASPSSSACSSAQRARARPVPCPRRAGSTTRRTSPTWSDQPVSGTTAT